MKFNYMEKMLFNEDPQGGGNSLVDPSPTTTTPPEGTTPATPPVDETTPEWAKGIDPELLKEPSLKTIKDVNALVKGYVNAQKLVGRDKIVIPNEYSTDEEWQGIYKKLGLPEADKYQINIEENAPYTEEFKKDFLATAHAAGILPKQAQKLFDFFHTQVSEANNMASTEIESSRTEAFQALKEEWGAGFEKNMETAKVAFKQFADEDVINYMKETGLAGDPVVIKLFAKIGQSLNEDTFSRDTVKHLGMTKDEAQRKIDEMMGNPAHPYYDTMHPGHSTAVADMQKYFGIVTSK